MAESRLRAARLYEPQKSGDRTPPFLAVEVEAMVGETTNAIAVNVEFFRLMVNPSTEGSVVVSTWRRGSYGYFGNRADPFDMVHTYLSDFVDEFIRDYLRVNEDDCP